MPRQNGTTVTKGIKRLSLESGILGSFIREDVYDWLQCEVIYRQLQGKNPELTTRLEKE
jgi:hypothetical protein